MLLHCANEPLSAISPTILRTSPGILPWALRSPYPSFKFFSCRNALSHCLVFELLCSIFHSGLGAFEPFPASCTPPTVCLCRLYFGKVFMCLWSPDHNLQFMQCLSIGSACLQAEHDLRELADLMSPTSMYCILLFLVLHQDSVCALVLYTTFLILTVSFPLARQRHLW